MTFTTNADNKRAFKAVAPYSKLDMDALEFVKTIIDKCILHMLPKQDINQYINDKRYGKLPKYIMFEVNATLRNRDTISTQFQQIKYLQFSKKLKSYHVDEIKMITIAVVTEYLMCDLYEKANNNEVNITVTKEMIFDGIKKNKDMTNFCNDFLNL